MFKKFFVYIQYVLPQHALSALMGRLAECRTPWLKNWLIQRFIRKYQVDMQLAAKENPEDYPSFNLFFIRQLKSALRPIAHDPQQIISPVDGTIAQLGSIHQNQLLQAKGFYFDLETLLGGDKTLAQAFYDGSFATLYLAPRDYHRVHMPISGTLVKTIYMPGKLFSVNRMTSELIPGLYSRNERLICLFNTEAGPVVIILVGALIVGSIQTVWMDKPIRARQTLTQTFNDNIHLEKGKELGYFKLGSTVILLCGVDKITFNENLASNSRIEMGQPLATLIRANKI